MDAANSSGPPRAPQAVSERWIAQAAGVMLGDQGSQIPKKPLKQGKGIWSPERSMSRQAVFRRQ